MFFTILKLKIIIFFHFKIKLIPPPQKKTISPIKKDFFIVLFYKQFRHLNKQI